MESQCTKFWSVMVITLSQAIIDAKKQAFSRIKIRSIHKGLRKMQRIDFESHKKSNSDANSYVSISDFKPLSSLYSSVKIYEQDFQAKQFQTKKQKIKHILSQNKDHIKLQDWMVSKKAKLVLPEDYPKSEFSKKPISSYSEQALNSIKGYKFQDFCQSKVKNKKTIFNFFGDRNPLKHKKESMTDSLTDLPDTKVEISIDIFDTLLAAGGEMETGYPTVVYVWRFLHQIFQQTDDIREQAFFQVIKQLSSHRKIYYQILACMSSTIQPSARMYLPLLNFIYFLSLDPQSIGNEEYHNFIFFSLIKNFTNPKKAPPSMFEIFCLMNLRKIPLLISFPRENIFFMESYSTVQEILNQLTQLYGLNKNYSYLFNIEGILLETGNILDGLSQSPQQQPQQQSLDNFLQFQGYRAFIVIKNMLQMSACEENFLIMYNYLVHQYRKGLFAVSNRVAIEIGGLIIASEVEMEECYQFSLAKYIPSKKYQGGISQAKVKQVQDLIICEYDKFKGTKKQARKQIIQKLSKSKAFLTHFFLCDIFIDMQEMSLAWVGLKTESIMVVEPYTSRIIMVIEYEKIRKWGRSKSQLCLKVDDIGDFHIETQRIDTLVSIFVNYLSYLDKQLKNPQPNAQK